MPRDGLSQYAPPPGTNGITNYTIESTKYNGFVADVTQDLNLPRPIVAGGTGANNAHDAMIALSGEIARQGPVTNYDTYPFVPGSFWSNGGATSEPAAGVPMSGVCYVHGSAPNTWLTIEARENGGVSNPGRKWVREKRTTWSAWTLQPGSTADLDAAYVNVAGDTMTGPLTINSILNVYANVNTPAHNGLSIGGAAKAVAPSAGQGSIQFYSNDPGVSGFGASVALMTDPTPANRRLKLEALEQGVAWRNVTLCETGGNVGIGTVNPAQKLVVAGDVALSGAFFSGPANITGSLTVSTTISAGGDIYVGNTTPSGVLRFGNAGAAYLQYTGTTYNLGGGSLTVPGGSIAAGAAIAGILTGDISVNRAGGTGAVFFGASTNYLFWTGTAFSLVGGPITVPGLTSSANIVASGGPITASAHLMTQNGIVYLNSAATAYINFNGTDTLVSGGSLAPQGNMLANGHIASLLGYLGQAGVSGTRSGNRFNIEYTTTPHLWINGADLGQLQMVSDYRVKKDVIDLPGMWDTVKALRPIKYTQADFTPPGEVKLRAEEAAARKAKADKGEPYSDDSVPTGPMFAADDIERWGFIAHELQDTLVPSAAHGVKDDPVAVQAPNAFTVIAALTKALQEAMTRIEALEGGAARR
jgi:hypothetical protein